MSYKQIEASREIRLCGNIGSYSFLFLDILKGE